MKFTAKTLKELLLVALISFLGVIVVWLPFFFGFKEGVLTLFKNYDGPNYIIVAKSWYHQEFIARNFSNPLPPAYYPAHFPGYPLTIYLLNYFFTGPWAMLLSSLIFTVLATLSFYLFLLKFNLSKNPLWSTIVFSFFPARWVAVKAVGSAEPLFLFAIIASFYFFKSAFDKVENNLLSKKKIVWLDLLLAGFFGALAQITKSPGIILFMAYIVYLFYKKIIENKSKFKLTNIILLFKSISPLLVIPLSLFCVFLFYQLRTGDFLAYFHSGDNFHLFFPPYQGFSASRSWLGDFWREDMIWQYFWGALSIIFLFRQKFFDLASFATLFFGATLFIAHRDLARYSLPLLPFALIAFDNFIQKKEFKIAFLIVLPAIYLYALNFIAGNTAPLADWSPYL